MHGHTRRSAGKNSSVSMQAPSTGRNSLLMNNSFMTNDLSESTRSSTTTTSESASARKDVGRTSTWGCTSQYKANPWARDPMTVSSDGFHVI